MTSTVTITIRSTCTSCLEPSPNTEDGLCESCRSLDGPEGVLRALFDDRVTINAAREAAGDHHHAGEE